jgi:two-component system, OmpR family, copper resistance phosphate regulon response regulator CusR
MRIFIIEDDAKTADAVRAGLEAEGYEVAVARTGDEGFSRLRSETADLVILDWMLPGRDGIEILKELRREGNKPSVLLLTARDAVEDRVLGLDSGADDYLVKPFAFAELLARLRVLLRRSGPEEAVRHQVADLSLDLRTRQVTRGAEEVALTPREFDVLLYLMRAEGQVVTRAMLAQEVWRETNRSTPLDNVIDVHLARLRRKIDEGRIVKLIHTVRGVGFLSGERPLPTPDKAGE